MQGSEFRILVVDDYEPWRRFVLTTLGKKPELRVVGQARDGLEAIQIAQQLQPDLIVLDIGLPSLNGPEAARRIRDISPKSKILFLSENRSLDVVETVFAIGAIGYVLKSDAASELLPAVETVLQNKKFVSSTIRRAGFPDVSAARPTDGHTPVDVNHWGITPRHEVIFYSDDKEFLDTSARFLEGAFAEGNAVVVVLSESRRIRLLAELRAKGIDMDMVIREGRYISLDPLETLSAFMVDNMPDDSRFFKAIGNLIRAAAQAAKGEHARVVACSECAPHLWSEGNSNAAVQLEKLCNQLIEMYRLDVLCGYALSNVESGKAAHVLDQICAEHSAVYSY